MRFFLHLSYLGTQYSGWQRQSVAPSVQQTIEDSISKILGEKKTIHGCGRTDGGVHASSYYAHIDIANYLDYDLVERLNLVLPDDIAISDLIPVIPTANAQRSAIQRTYEYYFHTKKDPALHHISAYYRHNTLAIERMIAAISIIERTQDFRSLCKQPDQHKHTCCRIDSITIQQTKDHHYKLEISADRFLRGMIRYIAARIIDVGSGALDVAAFERVVVTGAEFGFKYHKQGHPQGLFLSGVKYPSSIYD